MAKAQGSSFQNQSSFSKALVTDATGPFLPESSWTYARNAINNSVKGDLGTLSNEPSNLFCTQAPYVIIGSIFIEADKWIIFSTNNINSEIGVFYETSCDYSVLVNDNCLNFNSDYLIIGIAKPTFDCSFNIYWDDGYNLSRYLDISKVPWIQDCITINDCVTCVDTTALDCDAIRLDPLVNTPTVTLSKGSGVGQLFNGTYQVQIAYMLGNQKVGNWFSPSNFLTLFDHSNINGSINVVIENLDLRYDYYKVILITTVNQKTLTFDMGVYNIRDTNLSYDYIDLTLGTDNLADLTIMTPIPKKSNGIYKTGSYAVRVGPENKFNFNYQPLANKIETFWQSVEYKNTFYKNGGKHIGYMRDEVYCFFIRWIYDTGDKSPSFHIPGRADTIFSLTQDNGAALDINERLLCPYTQNDIETPLGYTPRVFEVYNTAYISNVAGSQLSDGGYVVAEGKMGYWESTESYDDLHPEVWNSNVNGRPDWDLCGKPIRHHKFPDNTIVTGNVTSTLTNHYKDNEPIIRIMGVKFQNVNPPVDNNGVLIPGITGYEILRSKRSGHKSVLYKGMINNMFKYNAPKLITDKEVLYPNYPFNDLRADPFISIDPDPTTYEPVVAIANNGMANYTPNTNYSKKHFTFHSPDTMFARPVLIDDEIKIYGVMHGTSRGNYYEVPEHPKHKLVKDLAMLGGIIAGISYATAQMNGTREQSYVGSSISNQPVFIGFSTSVGNITGAAAAAAATIGEINNNAFQGVNNTIDGLTGQNSGLASITQTVRQALAVSGRVQAFTPGTGANSGYITVTYKDQNQVPGILKILLLTAGNPLYLGYLAEGCDKLVKLIQAVSSWQQYALQSTSYCDYNQFYAPMPSNRRRKINDSRYLDRGLVEYTQNFLVNNQLRNETVILDTLTTIEDPHFLTPILQDKSRLQKFSNIPGNTIEKKFRSQSRKASSHYVAYKTRNQNQYGQLNSVMQLIATYGQVPVSETISPVIFGGDTYVGRYSEKNTLYYFDQWLNGEPNGAFWDYDKHRMFDHTAFWINTEPWDLMEFISSIPTAFQAAIADTSFATFFTSLVTPSDKYCVDKQPGFGETGLFTLKDAYFYLFNSGVRSFYVESEYNIDLRDYDDSQSKKHYEVFPDLKRMFNMENIRADNYYKYDRSLSAPFIAAQKIPWGKLQDFNYDPFLSASCYASFPNRLLYSLPFAQGVEDLLLNRADPWKIWLPQNFADFTSSVTAIKSINKTGALIFFKSQPPAILPGVSQFAVTSETLTIGDGKLWSRAIQHMSNADGPFEHGSCQSRLSVINSPAGIYWMCLNQGKIFQVSGENFEELSMIDNMFWLNLYLPYKLTEDFPTYSVLDNPVVGIGCQTIYDNEYGIIYFCKKDYKLKPNLPVTVVYAGGSKFLVNGIFYAETGDPRYFDNCSWTLSYDPKVKKFISFHDWHPDLNLGAKNTFLTTKKNTLWKHNNECQSFCNYYGVDYPFEVEFQLSNKMQVATTSNVEYYIESFVYDNNNCYDRFHVLDYGFDKAIVYNTEQISGLLNLNITPKNNLPLELSYPKINLTSIDILFSKEEQKYRFNQFWDITKDRGEYTTAQNVLLKTENNGYIRYVNANGVNYNKKEFERKKFRHYDNRVRLIRTVNSNVEIIVSLANSNQKISFR